MMSGDPVLECFEKLAERDIDVTPEIYKRYFARCPAAADLMSHIDDIARGKMMEEVYRLLLVEDYGDEQGYLDWEVDNHEVAYGVHPSMYADLFGATVESIKDSLGDEWNARYEQALQARVDALERQVVRRFKAMAAL